MDVRTIKEHIKKIYGGGELTEAETIRKIRIVQKEGTRQVSRDVAHYNLQIIIAVGRGENFIKKLPIWGNGKRNPQTALTNCTKSDTMKLCKRLHDGAFIVFEEKGLFFFISCANVCITRRE